MKAAMPALAALLLVSACGGGTSTSEQTADNLQAAADQSDPAAAQVLDNAAEAVRDQNSVDANATAPRPHWPRPATPRPGRRAKAPLRTYRAKPHQPGEPVPSEKPTSGQ